MPTENQQRKSNTEESTEPKIIIKIDEFKELFNDVISNIQWNQPIKGKCGWERGYWKKFLNEKNN